MQMFGDVKQLLLDRAHKVSVERAENTFSEEMDFCKHFCYTCKINGLQYCSFLYGNSFQAVRSIADLVGEEELMEVMASLHKPEDTGPIFGYKLKVK